MTDLYEKNRKAAKTCLERRIGVAPITETAAGWGSVFSAPFGDGRAVIGAVRPGQPACFGSDPDEQAFADNVCDACPHAHRCLGI